MPRTKHDYGGGIVPTPSRNPEKLEDDHRRSYASFWGKVVSIKTKPVNTKHGPQTEYEILIAMGRKIYQRCKIRSDHPFGFTASKLRHGDFVFMAGIYEEYDYEATEPIYREVWDKEKQRKVKKKFYDKVSGRKVEKTAFDFHIQFLVMKRVLDRILDQMDDRPEDPMYSGSVHDYLDYDAEENTDDYFTEPESAFYPREE